MGNLRCAGFTLMHRKRRRSPRDGTKRTSGVSLTPLHACSRSLNKEGQSRRNEVAVCLIHRSWFFANQKRQTQMREDRREKMGEKGKRGQTDRQTDRERERERERERQTDRQTERERETDRQTDRQREIERER